MKLPVDGKWAITQSLEKGLGLLATKNIDFDNAGFATLANRTITIFDETDDASFTSPVGVYQAPDLTKLEGISGNPYSITMGAVPTTISSDTGQTNVPALSQNTSQAFFNSKQFITENAALKYYDGSAYTNPSVSLTSGKRHPMTVHRGNNTLMIGDGNSVIQLNTSLSSTVNLAIPADTSVEVVGIAYNRALAAIITWDAKNHEAWLYIWDGATAAANYAYPLGSNRAFFVVPYKDTFVCLTGLGQLLEWASDGMSELASLAIFYTSAILGSIANRIDIAHDTAALVDGNKILFNLKAYAAAKGSEPSVYNPKMPGGMWCYDPAVGLYHRHAPSGVKLRQTTFSNPGPLDNAGIVPADVGSKGVPPDGTPFMITTVDGLIPTPIALNTIYYSYKSGVTTMQACSTRANALAGTFIPITGDHSSSAYKLLIMYESDFGQLAGQSYGGVLVKTGPQAFNLAAANFTIFQKYAFGYSDVCSHGSGDNQDIFGVVMDRAFNRGWLMTQKMYVANITDKLQKLYIKAQHLFTEHDQVIVKYRINDDANMPINVVGSLLNGVWTNGTTFTTTADLSAAKTALDAGHAYEVEIVSGAGSGYLAHIVSAVLAAGTWTVVIDETVRNIVATDSFLFVIDNWEKLADKDNNAAITSSSNPDYSEFPMAKGAPWLQFKIELRGYRVRIAEMDLVNTGEKPAL